MTKATLGSGNVDIVLDGEPATLKPTLLAAQTISRQAGGILSAIEAVSRFDIDAVTNVIALGLGKTSGEVAESVYETGVSALAPKTITFLTYLANGGRAPAKGGSGKGNPPKKGE